MATVVKNGVEKSKTATPKTTVQKKLANQAIGKNEAPISKEQKTEVQAETPIINLDDRMQKFEQLKGLAHQRTRLSDTLTDLNRFKYNQSDSATFFIKDSHGLEFKTTNTNLIHLITSHLKHTLETRKGEVEKQLVAFQL